MSRQLQELAHSGRAPKDRQGTVVVALSATLMSSCRICTLLDLMCVYCAVRCSDVVTATVGTSAKAAQEILKQNKKGRLPLVNAAGELVSGLFEPECGTAEPECGTAEGWNNTLYLLPAADVPQRGPASPVEGMGPQMLGNMCYRGHGLLSTS